MSSGERVCPTLRLSRPAQDTKPEENWREGAVNTERESAARSHSPGAGWILALSARSLPGAGCEAGVTSTSRGGQAGRSARARLAGRGSGARGGEHARARTPGSLGGRSCLPACLPACHGCGAAGRSLEGKRRRRLLQTPAAAAAATPLAARRCGPWRRRCCWAPAAAVQLSCC